MSDEKQMKIRCTDLTYLWKRAAIAQMTLDLPLPGGMVSIILLCWEKSKALMIAHAS